MGRHVRLDVRREYDAGDLGQGRCAGGVKVHQRNRFELFVRVANRFDNLEPDNHNNLDNIFQRIDRHRRNEGSKFKTMSYGSRFRDDMLDLLRRHDQGEQDAMNGWIAWWLGRLPSSEIKV